MYYGEKLSQERRLEIHNLIQEYKAGKTYSVNGKLVKPK